MTKAGIQKKDEKLSEVDGHVFNQQELKELKKLALKRDRIDRFSLVKEEKSYNPFMRNVGKSEHFSPVRGVTHQDDALDHHSPRVSGGMY